MTGVPLAPITLCCAECGTPAGTALFRESEDTNQLVGACPNCGGTVFAVKPTTSRP